MLIDTTNTCYNWLNDDIDKLIFDKIYRFSFNYNRGYGHDQCFYSINGIIKGKIKNYTGIAPINILNKLREKYNLYQINEINGNTLKKIIIDYSKILHQYGS